MIFGCKIIHFFRHPQYTKTVVFHALIFLQYSLIIKPIPTNNYSGKHALNADVTRYSFMIRCGLPQTLTCMNNAC